MDYILSLQELAIYLYFLLTFFPALDINMFINAAVAQSVEQRTENPRVTGSIPVGGT